MFAASTSPSDAIAEPNPSAELGDRLAGATPAVEPVGGSALVQRDRYYGDDESRDDVTTVPRNHHSDGDMSSPVGEIEARIALIEAELELVSPLVLERDRLLRARAALLGEPPPRPLRAGRRVTRGDVVAVLERHPGSRAGEIAGILGASQPVVSAHLYRGKHTRFESRGGRWFVRGAT
jgi:DNA-binding transcriptional ArsR family regulator